MNNPQPALAGRDARVDWLRGLAALLVLAHHLFALHDWSAHPALAGLAAIAAWFWLGVPIFFVLSGRCIGEAWLRGGSCGRFALRRMKRIYPPYLASLLVCLGVILIHKLTTGVNDIAPLPRTPASVLATLTLATAPATIVPTVNWVYWSLSYEVVFYALLAALLLLPPVRPRLLAWIGLHAILCGLDLAGLGAAATPGFFLSYWPLFGLGLGLALLPTHRLLAIASLSLSTLHLVILAALERTNVTHIVGLATAAALVLPVKMWRPRVNGPLPRIGVFSYSLYLVHVPVGVYLILRPSVSHLGPGLAGPTAALALAALGSLAAGWVFHRLAERPWMSPTAPAGS